jgi:hypothetical protein
MEAWEKFINQTNMDKEFLDSYIVMRKSLQDFGVHEWQLQKGYRIPGTIYQIRTETISKKMDLIATLQRYGLIHSEEDFKNLNDYFTAKLMKIDEEYPLQKGDKSDYMDDED